MKTNITALGHYLANRRNFMTFGVVGVGVPGIAWVTWLYFVYFAGYGPFLWLCMSVLAVLAAYVWALLMWKFFYADRARLLLARHDSTSKS